MGWCLFRAMTRLLTFWIPTGCLALTVLSAEAGLQELPAPLPSPLPQTLSLPKTETTTVPTREELQRLTPAEREARAERIREKRVTKMKETFKLSPVEKEARREQIQQRLQKKLDALRKKQNEGSLSAEEQTQLKRFEEISQRFKSSGKSRRERGQDGVPSLK